MINAVNLGMDALWLRSCFSCVSCSLRLVAKHKKSFGVGAAPGETRKQKSDTLLAWRARPETGCESRLAAACGSRRRVGYLVLAMMPSVVVNCVDEFKIAWVVGKRSPFEKSIRLSSISV
jgi:hypothetical protein